MNNVGDATCYRCGGATWQAGADAAVVDEQLREAEALLSRFEHQLEERAEPAAAASRKPATEPEVHVAVALADVPERAVESKSVTWKLGKFVEMPARAEVPGFTAQPKPAAWKPDNFVEMPALASLVNARLEEPGRRWRRNLVAGLIAVLALALPTGGYLHYRSGPAPGSTAVEASPPQALPDRHPDVPSAPIVALSQSTEGPAASRIDAAVSGPPPATDAAPEAASEARCPAAVEAIALCGWAVRAEQR